MEYFSKILHIDLNEESESIIERLSFLDDDNIIFTIPFGAKIFQNPSELKSLKRAIENYDKNIVLVSQDKHGLELAHDIGFKVEEEFLELLSPNDSTGSDPKYSAETHNHPRVLDIVYNQPSHRLQHPSPTKRSLSEPEAPSDEDSDSSAQHTEDTTKAQHKFPGPLDDSKDRESLPIKREKSKIFNTVNAIILFIVLSVGVASASMYMALPEAQITILPKKDTLVFDLSIKADKSLSEMNLSQNKIPGQILKIDKEETMEFEATGKSTGESKAFGTITIYNTQNPPQSQPLVKTTRLVTSDGKIFRITKNITVPSAKIDGKNIIPGSIDAEVVADMSGQKYNIGPSEFTIPGFIGSSKFTTFYGKSASAMQGGSEKGSGTAVTISDIEIAKKTMTQRLTEMSKSELKEKLPKDLKAVDDAIVTKVIEEKVLAQAGSAVEKFSIKMKVSTMAFMFQEKDIDLIVAKNLEKQVAAENLVSKNLRKTYNNIILDFSAGTMSFNTHIEQEISSSIDTDEIKTSLAGKDESEIRDYILSQESIDEAQVSFSPKFIKKAPQNPDKITVIIQE